MKNNMEITQLQIEIERILRPEIYLRWLDTHTPREEYTGITYTVCEMIFARDDEDDCCREDIDMDIDTDDDDDIWETLFANELPESLLDYDLYIEQVGNYLRVSDYDTKGVVVSVQLPEWIIDLDKLAHFQRAVNELPFCYWQVREYLLDRWGLDETNSNPLCVFEHWNY